MKTGAIIVGSEIDLPLQPPTARQTLCAEHQVIKRVLQVLKRLVNESSAGGPLDVENLESCVAFFHLFADLCHHAKEEDFLFPALEKRGVPNDGGPIGVMLAEHREARRLIGLMAQALAEYKQGNAAAALSFRDAAETYVNLLTTHIYKEDNVLFAMGDRVMNPQDQKGLCRRFGEVDCRVFDGKRRQELEAMADELERRLG